MLSARKRAAPTAPQALHQTRSYNTSDCLSNKIDYLLAGLLFGLQCAHLNSPERATVLDSIDGLLRLKIDLRRGGRHG